MASYDYDLGTISVIQKHDSAERFRRLGAEVRFGAPRFVDDHVVDTRAWVRALPVPKGRKARVVADRSMAFSNSWLW